METVIIDAGPLIAYLDAGDQHHDWAAAQFRLFDQPLLTCEAALSEAFFLLRDTAGAVERLLQLLDRGLVIPRLHLAQELPAIASLMRRYQQVPMSLADAGLVRLAELHPHAKVFTADSDFTIYRKNGRQTLPLIAPEK